jgi:hypothetical protein
MDIIHGKSLPITPIPLKHRGDGLSFKNLFSGIDGTRENYYFTLAHQGAFYSPRHKHNFDQFRFAVRGDVSLGPEMILRERELAYHPEGVEYGPQQDGAGLRDVLVLQFGGASGQGYLSYDQLAKGQAALKERGWFEGGKYYVNSNNNEGEGEVVDELVVDGFQALWEHYHKRPLVYPKPRFDNVVIMKPENFAWREYRSADHHDDDDDADGAVSGPVWRKLLGTFTERGTTVQMLRIDPGGRLRIDPTNAIQLLYVLRGEGTARLARSSRDEDDKTERFEEESAIRLNPDSEAIALLASGEWRVEILQFVLPML